MPRKIRRPLTTIRDVGETREIVKVERVEVPVEIIKEVEVIKEVPVKDTEAETRLENVLKELERVKAENEIRSPETPELPAEVAELLREGHSMGDAADELARRWAEFANLRQLNQELTPEQLAKEKRLQKALNWFQGDHSIEVV
jgi:hypothetical protein